MGLGSTTTMLNNSLLFGETSDWSSEKPGVSNAKIKSIGDRINQTPAMSRKSREPREEVRFAGDGTMEFRDGKYPDWSQYASSITRSLDLMRD